MTETTTFYPPNKPPIHGSDDGAVTFALVEERLVEAWGFLRRMPDREAGWLMDVRASSIYERGQLSRQELWELEIAQLARLNDAAATGNVAAEKELFKRMDKAALAELAERVADRGSRPPAPQPKLGKKASAKAAADLVTGKFAPPPQPKLLN